MPTSTTSEPLLTPGEVATRFAVNPKTVTRWAQQGKLSAIRTLGGHRRYRLSDVNALLASEGGHSLRPVPAEGTVDRGVMWVGGPAAPTPIDPADMDLWHFGKELKRWSADNEHWWTWNDLEERWDW